MARKDKRPTHAMGYELDANLLPVRRTIDTNRVGDYGCDPMPDGMFHMFPSGDIVDHTEKERRLKRYR